METVVKVSLRGPAPFGGSYHAPLTDPGVDRCLQAGYMISRVWEVEVRP